MLRSDLFLKIRYVFKGSIDFLDDAAMFRRMKRTSFRALISSLMLVALSGAGFAADNVAAVPAVDGSADKHLSYTKERFKTYMEARAKVTEPITVIFDGDSITDGWQGGGRKIWDKTFASRGAFDFGISGDKTQHVLWRLSQGQVEGLDPKLVLIMIGTNNLGSNTAEEIAEGVGAIVAEYQKRLPNAVIVLQAIFPRGQSPADPARAKIKAINEMIAKLGDGKKVVYVDFGDKFLAADGTLPAEVMPDFLHPSEKGYEIWAEAITPVVDEYCPAP